MNAWVDVSSIGAKRTVVLRSYDFRKWNLWASVCWRELDNNANRNWYFVRWAAVRSKFGETGM